MLLFTVLRTAGALAVTAWACTASAQVFPTKPVRIVTPFATGAGPEVALRLVGERLSQRWGQPVVIESKPGASGFIAIEAVKRAPADGHELLQLDDAQMSAQPFLFKKLPYDLFRDFEPITPIFRNYFFLTVPAGSPYKTVQDLVADAKSRGAQMNYGSWGVGSPGHIGAAMLQTYTHTQMTHVPYKDMPQLYVSVGNQQLDWAFGSGASAGPMQRAGKVRYLAVAAPKRLAAFQDVPTVAESGGPAGFELGSWTALLAPKGVPKAVVEQIQKDVAEVLKEPEVLQRYASMFYEPYALNSAQFMEQLRTDAQRYGRTITEHHISID